MSGMVRTGKFVRFSGRNASSRPSDCVEPISARSRCVDDVATQSRQVIPYPPWHASGTDRHRMLVFSNLRYAVWRLRSAPGIAFARVLPIAVGIGGNAAVFGFVRGLLFATPPIPDPANLVGFYQRAAGGEYEPWSFAEYEHLRSSVAPAIRATA